MGKQFDNLSKGSKNMSGFDGLLKNDQNKPKIAAILTKDINLKGVPNEVHRFLKIKANDDQTTIAKLILKAVIDHYKLDKSLE